MNRLSLSAEIILSLLVLSFICIFLFFVWQKKSYQSVSTDLILWNVGILTTLVFVTSSWQYYYIIALIPLMTTIFIINVLKAPAKLYPVILLSYVLMGINIKSPQIFLNQGITGAVILSHVFFGSLLLLIINIYLLYKFNRCDKYYPN